MRDSLVPLTGMLALLFAAECGIICTPLGAGQAMKIPYDAGAGSCYANLKNVPVFGPGVDQMLAIARGGAGFEARLHDVQETRTRLVQDYRALPSRSESQRDESLFVCAADDLLEAMFSAEAEALHSLPAAERGSRADLLIKLVRGINLDPQWNEYTRARIVERIRKQKSAAH